MADLATLEEAQAPMTMTAKVRDYVLDSVASNTQRAYKSDIGHFEEWARSKEVLVSYPVPPVIAADYLSYCADHLKMSTISRRIAALNYANKLKGGDRVQADPVVSSLISGIKRSLSVKVDQHEPLTIEKLRKIVARIDTSTLKGSRDKALLLIGFAGALRRSEITALNVEDVQRQEQGICVAIRRSKTDQEGEGDCVAIFYGSDPETCPVTALDNWLEFSGIEQGTLFRSITKWSKLREALTPDGVHRIVKERVSNAGYDPKEYGAHSLRAGAATTAASNGASDSEIARLGRWKPGSRVLQSYIRPATIFERTAAGKLGL